MANVMRHKLCLKFSDVCLLVKRPFVYASHGGELKIYVDGIQIATYPDGIFQEKIYCPQNIQYGDLVTFEAVTNDRVCSTWVLQKVFNLFRFKWRL